ncbi:MAG: TlpA family protein disulfide reductase [Armatimonadota bacterium]
MKTRSIVLLVVLAVLAIGIGLVVQHSATGKGPSKKPVEFTLTDVNGKKVKLSDYRGKVVVMDVWATWCGYCVREIPDLIQMQEKATKDKKPLQILGVSVDRDRSVVKGFAAEHKMNYPVLYGEDKALKPFGEVYGLPTKFIIDKKGIVVETIVGARPLRDLQFTVDKYLKEK